MTEAAGERASVTSIRSMTSGKGQGGEWIAAIIHAAFVETPSAVGVLQGMKRVLCALTLSAASAGAAVDFVKDIQPIFARSCYTCHGPHRSEAAFRLDHKPTALKGGDLGPAILPGKAAESLLIHAVTGKDPKMKMPRKGDPLSAAEIEKLTAWINEGAIWPDSASVKIEQKTDHWAFQPPKRPKAPAAAKHPIDAFIRAKLAEHGMKSAPKAARQTLIRRLHLDLTGLPPTLSDLSDTSDLSDIANKLLQSPHYGERWGRYWLDAAHYADSNGYEKDPMRHIWFYRDWVISALNRDLPYDQFIIEQLAGDQLPNATQDQIVATGFLRNSMINEEGGVDPEQFRMEAMFDRMDVIGKSVLGLTIGCTQCHNHKYDPITQEEYYRMFAFLNNDNETWRVVYTAPEQKQRAEVLGEVKALEDKLKHENPDWEKRLQSWQKAIPQVKWSTLAFEDDPAGGEKALRQPDGSILAQGYAPTKSEVKFAVKLDAPRTIRAFRIELMNDPNLPAYGPGRSQKGTAALTEFNVTHNNQKLKFVKASADFGEPKKTPLAPFARDQDAAKDKRVTGPVSYAIDGDDKTAWGIDAGPGRRNVPRNAVFTLEKPIEVKPGEEFTLGISMKHGGWNSDDLQTMNLGRYRVSSTDAADATADPLYGVKTPFTVFRQSVPEWAAVNAQIENAWKRHPEGTTSLVLDAREQPRMTTMLKRGDFTKPGDKVTTGVPAVLNPLPKNADSSRLTFAKWLVARDAPTTARAAVNRVWQAYFGTGLISTPEDLGTQGEMPQHRELLDWLAVEFMESGWSLKHLHRLIVTSETYQQDSRVTPEQLEKDPYNRLLGRGARFRVEGEVVRDIQLAVSGLLNPQVGGRPVMPPAPAFLFEKPASYAPFPWKVESDAQQYRRAVYVFRRRSTPYPFLSTFDVPNGEASCIRRARSNTPLQALMTLNETTSLEAAAALAKRMQAAADTPEKRVEAGFKLCTARKPSAKESTALLSLLKRQKERASKDKEAADAWTVVARVLLNLDETITRE